MRLTSKNGNPGPARSRTRTGWHTMRTTSTSVALFLLFNVHLSASRLLHLLPEDPYTLPKFRITYLNDLPLLTETAQRWLKDGLRGGQREFLEQSWDEGVTLPSRKEITSGEDPAHVRPKFLFVISHEILSEYIILPRSQSPCT
jgi:hypothetical protein